MSCRILGRDPALLLVDIHNYICKTPGLSFCHMIGHMTITFVITRAFQVLYH